MLLSYNNVIRHPPRQRLVVVLQQHYIYIPLRLRNLKWYTPTTTTSSSSCCSIPRCCMGSYTVPCSNTSTTTKVHDNSVNNHSMISIGKDTCTTAVIQMNMVEDSCIRYDTIQAQLVEINDRTTTLSSSSVQVSSCDHHHPRIPTPLYQPQQIIHLSYTITNHHINDDDDDDTRNHPNGMVSTMSQPPPPLSTTTNNTNDRTNIQVLSIHPIWLWCNDPTYIHETSGQHLRTHRLIQYYSYPNIEIQSVQVITRDGGNGTIMTTTIPMTTISSQHLPASGMVIPIPSPPPGTIHPRHVSSTVVSSSTVPSYLLRVIWTIDFLQQQQQMESYYDIAWLIRCLQNDNNRSDKDHSNIVTNDTYTNLVRITSQLQQPIGNHTTINNDCNHGNNTSVMVPCYNYKDLTVEHCNGEETLYHHKNTVIQSELSNIGCYHLLHNVFQYGAVLVNHVPLSSTQYQNHPNDSKTDDDHDSPVAQFGKALAGGRLSHGQLYGDVFHVRDKTTKPSNIVSVDAKNPQNNTTVHTRPSNDNIAYTTLALCPHQDLAYYESIPGLQLLHCIENDIHTVRGGESTLIDVIAAATEFQNRAPHLFDILVYCEATFLKQRDGADMIYRRPHIQYSHSDRRVVSVRWSPPFEGPLLSLPFHLMDDYYVAYTAFERMVDNALPRLHTTNDHTVVNRLLPRIPYELEIDLCNYAYTNTWEYRLRPGDLLIFNNQRMLHGRRSYTFMSPTTNVPTTSPADVATTNEGTNTGSCTGRHLMGCYTNIDDTLCHYRLLRRNYYKKLYEFPYIPIVGNGSSRVP